MAEDICLFNETYLEFNSQPVCYLADKPLVTGDRDIIAELALLQEAFLIKFDQVASDLLTQTEANTKQSEEIISEFVAAEIENDTKAILNAHNQKMAYRNAEHEYYEKNAQFLPNRTEIVKKLEQQKAAL